jgi:hypothetical protein
VFASSRKTASMSLHGSPIEETATLPDGRAVGIRVGVAPDSYIDGKDMNTVDVELTMNGEHVAVVNTVLDADQTSEALELTREIVRGLESGELEPTAGAIEPLADRLRA